MKLDMLFFLEENIQTDKRAWLHFFLLLSSAYRAAGASLRGNKISPFRVKQS